jgi:O-antigen/teichoic acid export membrane protein
MNNIAMQPVNLISQSLTKAYLQDLSEAKNSGLSLRGRFLKATGALALLGLVPFLILALWGRILFALIFGENWAIAGLYAQYMAPFYFMAFVNTPATQLFIVQEKLRLIFFYNILNSGGRIAIILVLCMLNKSPDTVLVAVSILGVIFNTSYIAIAYKNV